MARDKILPDSPVRDQLAFFRVAMGGAKRAGGPFKEQDLNGPLSILMALRRYGTCEELKEKYDRVRSAAIINKELPMDEEDRKRIAASFNELGGYVRDLAIRMNEIEKDLAARGWKFNAKTRRPERIAGHRGRDYLTECAVFYFRTLGAKTNTSAIRQKIASSLRDYFDPQELSTTAGAPIYTAIRHHLERG